MNRASGIDHLKPFFPGLESILDDLEVSELMINGPHNVWIEKAGRLSPHEAPSLDASALQRAAIHIARPLGLDPAASPIIDARLADGSRVAICVPPASPEVAITVRRFGGRTFSAQDLIRQGALPETVFSSAQDVLRRRRNILVSGGTGSGKTTLLNALVELLPRDERIVTIEDTLELRIERSNCLSGSRQASWRKAPSPSGTWSGTPCATGPITSWWERCEAARRPICCKPSTPVTAGRSRPCTPTTPHPPSRAWPVAPCRPAGRSPGTSPAAPWWTASPWSFT